MIEQVEIENFKSIVDLKLDLGAINVFIGENGAGKSNILEALALAGAAEARKLDNEFLASRGIRVTGSDLMRSAFSVESAKEPIVVSISSDDGNKTKYTLYNDNKSYSNWTTNINVEKLGEVGKESLKDFFVAYLGNVDEERGKEIVSALKAYAEGKQREENLEKILPRKSELEMNFSASKLKLGSFSIRDFLIFSPENTALRMFERDGQIEPLGINGEGLLKLLTVMSKSRDKKAISSVKESLRLFSWFDDFKIPKDNVRGQINITDIFIGEGFSNYDQRSTNEGFLFVAFYLALFSSKLTPSFFAVDNIDASLNPKLCRELIERLSRLAKENKKQAILTTHNPAVLDGMNLDDESQRLFVVSRNSKGHTKVRRFKKKVDVLPTRLSEMFLSGALGALPKGF